MNKYYLLQKDGTIQGISELNQGEGWILLPECPYEYGKWNGKEWVEDESKKADEIRKDLIRQEIEIMALERVLQKIKAADRDG